MRLRRAMRRKHLRSDDEQEPSCPRRRASSTPRPIDSITGVSGILDHPTSRVMTVGSGSRAYAKTSTASLFKQQPPSQTQLRDLAAQITRVFLKLPALSIQRAQGMPGARCARSLVCSVLVAHEVVTTGSPGNTRHSLRNGFNGFLRALPGDEFVLSPSGRPVRHPDLDNRLSP